MSISELCYLGAVAQSRLLRSRSVSAVELTVAHLDQIARHNPRLNAIVTLCADKALERAMELDQSAARGQFCGPLHGLPVAHKDLFDTAGIRTTYGSLLYKDQIPTANSLIVERMENAGAISLGKTNTPEFGAGSQTYNEVFGATRNPYDPSKTCGGSSGGSAVALACGMASLANGSDLGGSLRNPASFCGVVGLRPSAGRVPKWPSASGWFPLDVHGPMARSVEDVAFLLSVIAGPDARSPIAICEPGELFASPLSSNLKGLRVAWFKDLDGMPFEPEVRQIVNDRRKTFEQIGCIVEDAEPDFSGANEAFRILRAWYSALNHSERVAQNPGVLKATLANEVEQGLALGGAEVARAEKLRTELYHRMRVFFERYDAFVLPTVQVLPFPVEQPYVNEINGVALETYIDWMKSCYLISATGHPAISVPAGFSADGLPVGLQIVGKHQGERKLLELAYGFEQSAGVKCRKW